jgi:hypothetical protein
MTDCDSLIKYVRLTGLTSFLKSPPSGCSIHFLYFPTYYSAGHNPEREVAIGTEFCFVAPIIFGSSVWYLLYVTLQAPRNFWVAARFLENFVQPCIY